VDSCRIMRLLVIRDSIPNRKNTAPNAPRSEKNLEP
jgi:hypothetical protein